MKLLVSVVAGALMLAVQLPIVSSAATDNIYTLTEIIPAPAWEGTNGTRLQTSSTYGDERIVTFALPWEFSFYGQTYAAITPITLDTNGNIWFSQSTTTSAHSFGLDTTAGRGPVVAAWNDDLSSAYFGWVFTQYKNDTPLGERVVIEWQTETQADEGLFVPNSFETILFKDGRIRIDYGTIRTLAGSDSGSGISRGDGVYHDITSNASSVTALAGRSFLFTPVPRNLTVNFSGTGGGTITSSPVGISCDTNCSSAFQATQQITLHPATDPVSTFSGWTSGPCSGTGDCLLTLTTDTSVTAGFDRDTAHQVYVPGGATLYYSTIQAAYDNTTTGSTIRLWATSYSEMVDCNLEIAVLLQGGYDSPYVNQVGTTVIGGALTISQGEVTVDNITIR